MGGNIPGGNFLGGSLPGGRSFPGGSLMGGFFRVGIFLEPLAFNVHGRVIFVSSVRIFKKKLNLILISRKIYSWIARLLLNTVVYVLCWKIS